MVKTSTQQHKQQAAKQKAIAIALVTVSDSRNENTDENGHFLKKAIERKGQRVSGYRIIQDEVDQVKKALEDFSASDAQIIIFNGGTGISRRDRTHDALSKELQKTLPGFGELFRVLSFNQVGAAAMLSRACAGIYKNKVVISIPGSPQAVRLAWRRLIEPELQHLAWELTR